MHVLLRANLGDVAACRNLLNVFAHGSTPFQAEKEKEVARLRALQERAQDRQSQVCLCVGGVLIKISDYFNGELPLLTV